MMCAMSDHVGAKADCTVKALALTAGISYLDAFQLCAKLGRKRKGGFWLIDPITDKSKAFESLGFEVKEMRMGKRFGKTVRTWGRGFKFHLESQLKKQENPIVIWSTGHVTAVLDGEVCDWAEGRCKRIEKVYEIIKK